MNLIDRIKRAYQGWKENRPSFELMMDEKNAERMQRLVQASHASGPVEVAQQALAFYEAIQRWVNPEEPTIIQGEGKTTYISTYFRFAPEEAKATAPGTEGRNNVEYSIGFRVRHRQRIDRMVAALGAPSRLAVIKQALSLYELIATEYSLLRPLILKIGDKQIDLYLSGMPTIERGDDVIDASAYFKWRRQKEDERKE